MPRSQPGEQHPRWRGEEVLPQAGRSRALRRFSLAGRTCAECEVAPAVLRHHWDGDPLNNAVTNVVFLCKRCHQRIHLSLPPRPCAECGRSSKRLTRGLCDACYWRSRHPSAAPRGPVQGPRHQS